MLAIISVLVFTSFGTIAKTSASPVCTEEKFKECYDLLSRDQLPPATVLYYSEEVMTEHCRHYKIFAECMNTIRPYCKNVANFTTQVYQGVDDALGFVCNSGFGDYLKHQKCFREEDVQSEAKTCISIYLSRQAYLKNNVTSQQYARARFCQYTNDYVDCVYNLVESFCEKEAADWHLTYDRKSYEPVMTYLKCDGWPIPTTVSPSADRSGMIWVIALAVVVGVTGLIVSASLVVLICSRCSCVVCRRSSSSSHRSLSATDMPPPYSGPFIICRSNDDLSATGTPGGSSGPSPSQGDDTDAGALPFYAQRTWSTLPRPSSSTSTSEKRRTKRRSRNIDGKNPSSPPRSYSPPASVPESGDEAIGAVGGSSPFVRPITPPTGGHFEMPSPASSILSHLQSSDDDTSSLISRNTCEYY